MKKFKKHFPKWKQKYNTRKIIDELISKLKPHGKSFRAYYFKKDEK